MQIAQVIGGYTLGGADLLRRAMGKKNPEEMAKQRDIFVAGAEKNGLPKAQGDAALRPDGEVRRLRLQQVARRRLRAGRLPDRVLQGAPPGGVHGGQPVAGDGRHRQGARALRRRASRTASRSCRPTSTRRTTASSRSTPSGSATASAASRAPASRRSRRSSPRARAGGPFRDLFDFCRRVDKRIVNRRVVEALIRAGAFDAIEPRRATLFASVGVALAEAEHAEAAAAQVSLFGEEQRRGRARARRGARVDRGRAARAREGGARLLPLGASVRGVRRGARAARPAAARRTCSRRSEPVLVAGIVTALRVQTTRRGKMAFVTLDDGGGIGGDRRLQRDLRRRAQPAARGPARRSSRRRSCSASATTARRRACASSPRPSTTSRAIRKRYAKALRLACNGGADAARLAELLAPFRNGSCPIVVEYRNRGVGGELELPDAWRVNLDDPLLAQLEDWLAPENVRVVYARWRRARAARRTSVPGRVATRADAVGASPARPDAATRAVARSCGLQHLAGVVLRQLVDETRRPSAA